MPDDIKDKIIVALDVPTVEEARKHIADLNDSVGAFKIGLQLFTAAGADFVRETAENGIKLFLDVKFHDIPVTVAKASVEAARLGVWMFNIHASGGGEMIRITVESVREVCEKENLQRPKIIGVTVLTSSNSETLKQAGVECDVEDQVLNLAKLSNSCGLDGVVASPNETELIRKNIPREDFLIVTPGVRLEIVENDDQKRVMTPGAAIAGGSDYLVIGRPILGAEDKLGAVRQIVENIRTQSI